ncbi:hypothetical protein TRFO_37630 [Tritrichomonas foetus]|uniref:adenylate cyclase n=1 Tax=Tritrichomonas foetus TaxID=1144522 RepID=A0A1J4JF20_9EUKA|nr:hypothetical protein TRFO_37630 [Tritrichomonas foetus]|eukprot:OHS96243.1 hypothetical protein TRFO_37630 [Tritrichomonas foetus]
MDWTSWTGLEHWYYFNHIGHYFNTSPQLPSVIYLISYAVIYIQCIPILSSILISEEEHGNSITEGLKVLFRVIVYLNFIPQRHLAASLLVIMVIISLFFIFTSQIRSGRLLQNGMSFFLRLLTEFLTPILLIWSAATTERLARDFLNDDESLPFLVISVVATVGYLLIFLIISYFQSRTLFLRSFLFETWNTSFHCFLVSLSVCLIQTWLLIDAFIDSGIYIVLGISTLVNILLFFALLTLPYIQSVINSIALIIVLFLVLLHGLFFISHIYPSRNSILYFGISVALLLISIIVGPTLQNMMCKHYLNVSGKEEEDEEEESSELLDLDKQEVNKPNHNYSSNSLQLNNIRPNNLSPNSLRQNGLHQNFRDNNQENNHEHEHFKNSRIDVYKLRQLFLTDRRRAEKFATFLLNTSSKVDDVMESFRILTILHVPPTQRIIEYTIMKLDSQQLLCDLQYEAIAREFTEASTEEILSHLEAKELVIKRNLSAIADSIQLTNKEDTFSFIRNYAKECNEYEMMVSFILVHAPYSPSITQHLSTYFNNLRGDMEQAQTWLQNSDGLRKSSSFSGYRSRLAVNVSSARINDLGGMQRLNSQKALQKIHSNALRGSIIFFIFALIVAITCAFFKFHPQTVEYITSETVSQATVQLSTFTIAPLFSLFELMSNVLSDCSPSNAKKFENLFNHVIIPFNSGVNQIVTALELISQALQIVDRNSDDENGYYSYSNLLITKDNISLQLLMNQIHKISEVVPKGQCLFKYLQLVNEFNEKIVYCFEPLQSLKQLLYNCSEASVEKYEKQYIRDYIILVVFLFVMLTIASLYIGLFTEKERRKFWTEFSELDDGDLEKFQKQLLVVHEKVETTPLEDNNLLAPDEIEAPETERLILTNELLPLGKLKKRFNYFPLVTALFFIVFGVSMYCYQIPFKLTLKIDMNLDFVSHFLQTIIAQHTSKIIDYTYKALFTAIPISSSLLEDNIESPIFESPYDFYNFSYLLDNYNSYFRDAAEFQSQLMNVTTESLKYGEAWIIFKLDDNFFNMVWLAFHNVTGLSNQISEWYFEKHNKLNTMRTICSHSVSAFLSLVLVAYAIVVIHHLRLYQLEFESLKALIIILPSQYFGSTANIIESFKPHSTKKVGSKRFRSRYIIKHSVNPIIVIDANRHIQDVNKATIELFGYKRDALIRTDLMTLFVTNDHQSDDFFAQLTFMNTQNTSNLPLREFNLNALPSEGEAIPVNCTLIPIGDTESTDSPAFAVLLRDRSEFLKQDIAYRNMQHQVESLLLRIMPKVMVMKLLAKNQILHSQVNHATFMFIGIVNFIDWCKVHTHTEIMELLDVIVSAFDKKISKFLSLVKIKIINGVYMAAGGLFEEVSEKPHEVEMVEFAIKCVRWIQNRNRLTSSNLQLQIGINTGGPIIAGILGHDKPFFDVYGDAVNVAARLETSAEHGTIQISQEMKDAIPEGMFILKERQHVFLKGKGDATTYQVIIPEETPKTQ